MNSLPFSPVVISSILLVQDNLHAHAQNEPIKNLVIPTTLCRAMPFSARALKENIFFDADIVVKT